MNWRISEPDHLLGAMRLSLHEGGRYLAERVAPNGPIGGAPLLSYVHKASWGMYAAGVDHDLIARVLDWVQQETLRDNGDFYIDGEAPEYKDMQRVYRALTFGKVAAWIEHPLASNQQVIDRILQYQHQPSGGAFAYIGDDPAHVEAQATIGSLNTTFFGHFMIAVDLREQALAAGRWVQRWIEANRPHMAEGVLYTQMTPEGELVTDVGPNERVLKVLDLQHPRQEFWQTGTSIAYLAVLYDTMRSRWGADEAEARPLLDAAIELLAFDEAMPLDTYLWPSKCKVAWGAGELLRVLVTYGLGDAELVERAYRVGERVAIFTFMDNQLPDGGWSAMHYPLTDQAAAAYSYKPLKRIVRAPDHALDDGQTIFLPREEITGEFLGEMKSVEQGVAAMLAAPRD